jgi:hypothetical protein
MIVARGSIGRTRIEGSEEQTSPRALISIWVKNLGRKIQGPGNTGAAGEQGQASSATEARMSPQVR